MSKYAVTVPVGGATLLAVPAAHFRLPFAEAVNRVCADPATRPDAIAVELGPDAAAVMRAWLREIGIGPNLRRRLPCMLALSRANRLVHPTMRKRAQALQRETGLELHQIPLEVLAQEIGFRGTAVLPLSPTDSIVEAVRCSVELGIPLYGIDLEESADAYRPDTVIEAPDWAGAEIRDYVERNSRRALGHHDPIIDPRREMVMAARLKAVLGHHPRVLWTGGLGHWVRLAALLADPAVLPATTGIDGAHIQTSTTWHRHVVKPSTAVRHMELPALTWLWERYRPHPLLGGPSPRHAPEPSALLGHIFAHAYAKHLAATSSIARTASDWAATGAFEQLLAGEMRLSLDPTPNCTVILRCASATLSDGLCDALVRALTRYPWANLAQFPGATPLGDNEGSCGTETSAGGSASGEVWPDGVGTFTWRPWERLASTLSILASARVRGRSQQTTSEPFSGQMRRGIDPRRTVREYARGREQIYVRDTRRRHSREPEALLDVFPVVWIFDNNPSKTGDFSVLRTHVPWLLQAAPDRAALDQLRRDDGADMVDIVLFEEGDLDDREACSASYCARGFLLLRPQCPSLRQEAAWMLRTRCPIEPTFASIPWFGGLSQASKSAIRLDGDAEVQELRWQDELILFGLSFAKKTLTVVAPKGFSPARTVKGQAARQHKRLGRLGLDAFDPQHIDRLRSIHMARAQVEGHSGRFVYRDDPGKSIGEDENRYRELVPRSWRKYLW